MKLGLRKEDYTEKSLKEFFLIFDTVIISKRRVNQGQNKAQIKYEQEMKEPDFAEESNWFSTLFK